MRAVLGAMVVGLLAAAPGGPPPEAERPKAFLADSLGLSAADFDRLERGLIVTRTLDATDRREVATLGAARLKITPEFYAGRLADVADFKKDEAVLQIGVFGDPAAVSDVNGLTFDESDLRSLRACRVGDCGLQLPAAAIDRLRGEVSWHGSDAARQANAILREVLVDYVTRYRRSGAGAAMEYVDSSRPIRPGAEFAALATSPGGLATLKPFPKLRDHVLEYPVTIAPETMDVIYWSKERVGRREVVSVTHLAIWRSAGESPADYAIASKQIYGSHYFDASLGMTVLVRDLPAASPSTFVGYVNRTRVDVFRGPFGRIVRKVVSSKARSTVADQLARMQRVLEAQFAAIRSSPGKPEIGRPPFE